MLGKTCNWTNSQVKDQMCQKWTKWSSSTGPSGQRSWMVHLVLQACPLEWRRWKMNWCEMTEITYMLEWPSGPSKLPSGLSGQTSVGAHYEDELLRVDRNYMLSDSTWRLQMPTPIASKLLTALLQRQCLPSNVGQSVFERFRFVSVVMRQVRNVSSDNEPERTSVG